jgi:uncharacterized membrane protein
MQTFSIKEALSFGWRATWDNLSFFLMVIAITFGVTLGGQALIKIGDHSGTITPVVMVAAALLGIVMKIGWIRIVLDITSQETPKWEDLFLNYNLFFPFAIASVLYCFIVLGGTILLIVPGIILSLMLGFYTYGIVDKKLNPLEALKLSKTLTYGAKWKLFGFVLLLGLINLGGALVLLVGLFITLPLSMLAHAHVYRQLSQKLAPSPTAPNTSQPTLAL